MALTAVQPAMPLEEEKPTHPFFSRPTPESKEPAAEPPTDDAHDDPDHEQRGPKKRGRKPGSKNKAKTENIPERTKQPSLEQFTRRLNGGHTDDDTATGQDAAGEASLEEDPNQDRRKRRKKTPPGPLVDAGGETMGPLPVEINAPQTDKPPEALQRATTPPNVPPQPQNSTPKKRLLKFNKNGKLLPSPPAPAISEPETMLPKRRRTQKTKPPPTASIIQYGHDAASRKILGQKIDDILSGKKPACRPATPKKQPPPPPKPSGPPKSTHPFFLGKAAKKNDDPAPSVSTTKPASQLSPRAQKKSAVTPGKLRAESQSYQSNLSKPAFGSGFGNARQSTSAGLNEALWPSKATAHVRNLDEDALPFSSITKSSKLGDRKMKRSILRVPEEEDIMTMLARQLKSSIDERKIVPASDFEPPRDVRLPIRSLTTGASIQDKVRFQVGAALPSPGVASKETDSTHPAIQALFRDIENTLTPFDLGKCETQAWTSKYAPKHATHVLQTGKEAMVLYDWLQSLTVMAVSGKRQAAKTPDVRKPPKKKRRKAEDDFIVDSDEEEEEEWIELPRTEYSGLPACLKSTRMKRWTRSKNVVVISGPPGCGKSAMVHAVAKDLDFEVFEINSGSRRSGSDIRDKVGDMSENHLVNHKRHELPSKLDIASADDTEPEQQDETLQNDIASGRQSTMASFFKTSAPVKKTPATKAPETRKASTPAQATLSVGQAQQKSQKQSLILLEEADILFEEDEPFWPTVIKLASQSKRPIVITCNDEQRIPLYDLPLGAVLRLPMPPADLATDYMLVLAGREGHVLQREAVTSLYKSKGHDLRASITELNLWCQMSVGDRKGGLEWMYQRWPVGTDVDEHGRLLRVASEDTYVPGMGCLSHNVCEGSNNIAFDKQNELLKGIWQDWGISPCDWTAREEKTDEPWMLTDTKQLETLKRLDALSDSISAADVYCHIDLPSYERSHDQPTDPTVPPLREKERSNYTVFPSVLQTDHVTDFSNFDTDVFVQSHLLIQRTYADLQWPAEEIHLMPTTEAGFAEAILDHKQCVLSKTSLSRPDFSFAFDYLGDPPDTTGTTSMTYPLTASSLDRTFRIVVEDLAPYVRSIVAHELALETQRIRLGSLLSEGGRTSTKRARTTRAARTAMEGGERRMKRRENWFIKDLNRTLVMGTAGKSWAGMGAVTGTETETEGSVQTGDL
ncbi:P-loop containing nucleoside triphosphate hydrolase protein [Massarina eburnea CBS 473.64]|uniref:P-loop containing nucleoside triphosphate hydrolase protein n=1 Tax=Massarina eburnea CBS 473.64 TaxID=1395130 RepID=A0A6A6SFB6_9PLEO|nr:P-loop containing nucleoside triphosphate hydrolase protein [Massarina eburnea CBS 473.64]